MITVQTRADHVAVIEFSRPPANFFDVELIRALADAYVELDELGSSRAIVLCSSGRHFCAGADFSNEKGIGTSDLYAQAIRLFSCETPVVAAVQGAAIGGGLGLALSADFRVASPESRFSANFARLGIHHGFGLTVTLPAVVGMQAALDLLYTGRRVKGEQAHALGLCDRLAAPDQLRQRAIELAGEIAASAPQAVRAIRRTMRGDLPDRIRGATAHEADEQTALFSTQDFAEGVAASAARRQPESRVADAPRRRHVQGTAEHAVEVGGGLVVLAVSLGLWRSRHTQRITRLPRPWSDDYAVSEVNHAVSEAALVEEFEPCADVVGQCALAAAHHDRPEEQLALVDQPESERLTGELGAPDRDVSFGGLLEPADGIGVEVALDPGPRAGYRLKGPGVHDLLGRPPDLGEVPADRWLILAGAHALPDRPSSRTSADRKGRCRSTARDR